MTLERAKQRADAIAITEIALPKDFACGEDLEVWLAEQGFAPLTLAEVHCAGLHLDRMKPFAAIDSGEATPLQNACKPGIVRYPEGIGRWEWVGGLLTATDGPWTQGFRIKVKKA